MPCPRKCWTAVWIRPCRPPAPATSSTGSSCSSATRKRESGQPDLPRPEAAPERAAAHRRGRPSGYLEAELPLHPGDPEGQGHPAQEPAPLLGHIDPLAYQQDPFGLLGVPQAWRQPASSPCSGPRPACSRKADVRITAHKSTALAAATFMLALRAEGYDSCPIEGFDPWRAKRLLHLPGAPRCACSWPWASATDKAIWWERILVPKEWVVREL